jgi:DNA-binding transcriptional regulator YbjK
MEITDGRRRKGAERRRLLVAATTRVIGRAGLASVSQRVVAAEAGVPPSVVSYYFPTVDDLLVAALVEANDAYLADLAESAVAPDPLGALAARIATWFDTGREVVTAEYELYLLAARRPELHPEVGRWTTALDAFLAPLVADPLRRTGVAAAVDGLILRCFWEPTLPDAGTLRAVLAGLIDH